VPIILTRKKSMVLGLGLLGSFFVISGIIISIHNSSRTPPSSGTLNRATIEGATGLSLSQTPGAGIGFVLNDFHRSAVKNGEIVWEIFGKKGRYDAGKNRAEIEEPRLNVNRENGETVNLTAKRADVELTGTEILKAELFDDVVVVHNHETTIKTDRAIYVKATETIDMPNYVKVENPIFTIFGKKLHGNITSQTIEITNGVKSTFKPRPKSKKR
jgi:LPS export ABC transporter protein LptC